MELRQKLFKKFALVLFFLFVVNTLANIFFWYQSLAWFDTMTHFFGGVAGGLFLLWFFFKKYSVWRRTSKHLYIVLLNSIGFLIVAVLWEVMEFSVQDLFEIGNALAERTDSISDLLFGLAGNFLSLIYYFLKPQYKNVRD